MIFLSQTSYDFIYDESVYGDGELNLRVRLSLCNTAESVSRPSLKCGKEEKRGKLNNEIKEKLNWSNKF